MKYHDTEDNLNPQYNIPILQEIIKRNNKEYSIDDLIIDYKRETGVDLNTAKNAVEYYFQHELIDLPKAVLQEEQHQQIDFIDCPSCHSSVAKSAAICFRCGYPMKEQEVIRRFKPSSAPRREIHSQQKPLGFWDIVWAIVVAMIIMSLGTGLIFAIAIILLRG